MGILKFSDKKDSRISFLRKFSITNESIPSKVVLFQTGYYEPGMGTPIDMKKDGLEKMVENFDEGVIQRPSVYYGHWGFTDGRKAAGEITSLYIQYNEKTQKEMLMGNINWI